MNKPKYYILGRESVIATVYESSEFGRTMVINPFDDEEREVSFRMIDAITFDTVSESSLMEFFYSMIPIDVDI